MFKKIKIALPILICWILELEPEVTLEPEIGTGLT
jgi:hypothetical protein